MSVLRCTEINIGKCRKSVISAFHEVMASLSQQQGLQFLTSPDLRCSPSTCCVAGKETLIAWLPGICMHLFKRPLSCSPITQRESRKWRPCARAPQVHPIVPGLGSFLSRMLKGDRCTPVPSADDFLCVVMVLGLVAFPLKPLAWQIIFLPLDNLFSSLSYRVVICKILGVVPKDFWRLKKKFMSCDLVILVLFKYYIF